MRVCHHHFVKHQASSDALEAWQELGFFSHSLRPQGTAAHSLSGNPQATYSLTLQRSARLPFPVRNIPMRRLIHHIGLTPHEKQFRISTAMEGWRKESAKWEYCRVSKSRRGPKKPEETNVTSKKRKKFWKGVDGPIGILFSVSGALFLFWDLVNQCHPTLPRCGRPTNHCFGVYVIRRSTQDWPFSS